MCAKERQHVPYYLLDDKHTASTGLERVPRVIFVILEELIVVFDCVCTELPPQCLTPQSIQ
jgi:hypothetical protein